MTIWGKPFAMMIVGVPIIPLGTCVNEACWTECTQPDVPGRVWLRPGTA